MAEREQTLLDTLHHGLNQSDFEGYMTELGMVHAELDYCLHRVGKWAKPKWVATPLARFSAKSFVLSKPCGVVLTMSPWNYPLQLANWIDLPMRYHPYTAGKLRLVRKFMK